MATRNSTSNRATGSNTPSYSPELNRIPPQAIDLEEAVLGAIMLEKDSIFTVSEILKKESFYKEANGEIYAAALELSSEHEPVDLLTVTNALRRKKLLEQVGGSAYLSSLTLRIASASNIEYHSRIIQQKFIQRELIRVSSEIQQKAYDDSIDVDDLLNESADAVFEVSQNNVKKDAQPIDVLLSEAIEKIEHLRDQKEAFSGIPSGYTQLDRLTSGWQSSDLIIVAGRPSMGKTAFALSMARNMAIDHSRYVGLFSLEMSSLSVMNRLIVAETELEANKIRNGKLTKDEMQQLYDKTKRLGRAKFFIDDTPGISVTELRSKCQKLKQKGQLDIIVIDYLQLMTYGVRDMKGNREQEISMISRSLKALARDLEVPVIALSQLNRGVEQRTGIANKKPQLSDLRESGAIEQDADLVLFVHRPEYYGFKEYENGDSTEGMGDIIVAKHRNGGLDEIHLRFRKEFARFDEYSAYDSISNVDDPGYVRISSNMNSNNMPSDESFDTPSAGSQPVPF